MIWGVLAVIVLGLLGLVLLWQRRLSAGVDRRVLKVSLYRQQLDELEADRARGLIAEAEAEAARAEIGRRILKADAAAAQSDSRQGSVAIPLGLVLVALGAGIGLYGQFGQPMLADHDSRPPPAPAPTDGQPRMEDLLVQLADQLKKNPDRLDGWRLLARSAAGAGKFQEAARAYRRAIALAPDDVGLHISLGEVFVALAQGRLVPAARLAFQQAGAIDPRHPAPRFYNGMAHLQDGDTQGAIEIWQAMLDGAPENAPWRGRVESQLQQARAQLQPDRRMPGPSQEQMAAMADLPAEEQQAFIRSMVDGLAQRLEENPDDLEGWLRLANARQVLGDTEDAIAALQRAIALAPPELATQLQNQVSALENGSARN